MKQQTIEDFVSYLKEEERAAGTIEKYVRDVRAFTAFAGKLTKENLSAWKTHLIDSGYAPVTINSMLAAVHTFLNFSGHGDIKVKYLKVQRRLFRDPKRELSREEYDRLIGEAKAGNKEKLALLMETICATGVRVSEVKYITVEAARNGRAEIALKGKIRTIMIPGKLAKKLKKYAKKQKIASGELFLAESGDPMNRRQIWNEMKRLCRRAGVESSKVFPHNLRHLFAVTFYKVYRDIVKLADLLGHSSINTTRIYLVSSGEEHAKQLDKLGLIT